MENFVEKICPYCNFQIMEGSATVVCPTCGTPHHEKCWSKNGGCATPGCSAQVQQQPQQQAYAPSEPIVPPSVPDAASAANPATPDVCPNCGTVYEADQIFCTRCGTPKPHRDTNLCGKCGTPLVPGQEFCSKCGQRAGLAMDASVNSAINQFNAGVVKTNASKKKLPLIIGGVIAALVAIIIVATVISNISGSSSSSTSTSSKPSFSQIYSDLGAPSYCKLASDGSYLSIDTNPSDKEDYLNRDAAADIEVINDKLGLPESLYQEMLETRAMDGRQTRTFDNIEVSWTYHPDDGLEVMYKRK